MSGRASKIRRQVQGAINTLTHQYAKTGAGKKKLGFLNYGTPQARKIIASHVRSLRKNLKGQVRVREALSKNKVQ